MIMLNTRPRYFPIRIPEQSMVAPTDAVERRRGKAGARTPHRPQQDEVLPVPPQACTYAGRGV